MKWYFASRTRHRETIAKVTKFLEEQHQSVMSDWVFQYPPKPFHEHLQETHALANSIVDSILQADIFVLISDPEGTDMFIELGIAIAQQKQLPNMRIYIIGEHNKRSLMHLYPTIIHTDSLAEVFERESIPMNIDIQI